MGWDKEGWESREREDGGHRRSPGHTHRAEAACGMSLGRRVQGSPKGPWLAWEVLHRWHCLGTVMVTDDNSAGTTQGAGESLVQPWPRGSGLTPFPALSTCRLRKKPLYQASSGHMEETFKVVLLPG